MWLYVRQIWMIQLILAIICDGYLPLIRRVSITHMHGLVKERPHFARGLPLKNSVEPKLCFWLALLHSVSYVFFLDWSPSSLYKIFDSISSYIVAVLQINSSADVLVFGNFNVHHNDWPTYFGGTDRSGDLTQIINVVVRQ